MTDDASFDDEIKRDFLDEVSGLLDQCEESYLKLEEPSCRAEELAKIFRAVHSMKGAGAAVGFTELAAFAHVVEDCLCLLRNKPELLDVSVLSILLRSGDEFKKCIAMLRAKDPSPWEIDEFKGEVKALAVRLSGNETSAPETAPSEPQHDDDPKTSEAAQEVADEYERCIAMLKAKDPAPWQIEEFRAEVRELVLRLAESDGGVPETPRQEGKAQRGSLGGSGVPAASIKVDAERIERVLNIAGELLVLKSQVENHCKAYPNDGRLKYLLSLMDKSISEVHDKTLSMRMTPLKNLFLKTQRVIRDLSVKLGKPVDFLMSGEATEIDRTMVDLLGDPLMHIARNSLDHGIESAEVRKSRGKREKGSIHLSAFQTGGRVVVKIDDDGGGINREKIIRKAKEKGLLAEATNPQSLTDKQVFDFLFAPGFSTAENVTDVSGRGVGMDVVKTNIERIKGVVEIETSEGHGTSLTISLPLTTAITEGMIIRIASEFYILPMDCIEQLLKLEVGEVVKMHSGQEIVTRRNKLYSLFRLDEIFRDSIPDIAARARGESLDGESCSTRVVLVNTGKQVAAVAVNEVLGQTQAVLKPLGDGYQKTDGISGAAVLGNGRLALVLDPLGLERIFASRAMPDSAPHQKDGLVQELAL